MSTPNFRNKNASFIYAIGENYNNEIDWDIILERIEEELKKQKFDILTKAKWLDDDSRVLGEKQVWDRKGICSYVLQAVIRSGYYSGANLDWEISFYDLNNCELDELSIEEIRDTCEYNEIKITDKQIEAIERKLNTELEKDIKKLEKLYSWLSTPLNCIGIFSNGEAVYEEVKKR